MTTKRLYFWHATMQTVSSSLEHSFGTFSTRSVGPEFIEGAKVVVGEVNNWPVGSFVITSLSFLGEYEHETG